MGPGRFELPSRAPEARILTKLDYRPLPELAVGELFNLSSDGPESRVEQAGYLRMRERAGADVPGPLDGFDGLDLAK